MIFENKTTEKFKFILERYILCDSGFVFDTKQNKVVKFYLSNYGYLNCFLIINGKQSTFLQHRLIAIYFIQNPDIKPQINHINGIKTDNKISNLEWCTAKENIRHALDTGLAKRRKSESINLSCNNCGVEFKIKNYRYKFKINRGALNFFCSKSCSKQHFKNQFLNYNNFLHNTPTP